MAGIIIVLTCIVEFIMIIMHISVEGTTEHSIDHFFVTGCVCLHSRIICNFHLEKCHIVKVNEVLQSRTVTMTG